MLQELYGGDAHSPKPCVGNWYVRNIDLPENLETPEVLSRGMAKRLAAELDHGETVPTFWPRKHRRSLLLIDEKLGRQAAVREGVAITRLMGVLVEAKRVGRSFGARIRRTNSKTRPTRVSDGVKREIFLAASERLRGRQRPHSVKRTELPCSA